MFYSIHVSLQIYKRTLLYYLDFWFILYRGFFNSKLNILYVKRSTERKKHINWPLTRYVLFLLKQRISTYIGNSLSMTIFRSMIVVYYIVSVILKKLYLELRSFMKYFEPFYHRTFSNSDIYTVNTLVPFRLKDFKSITLC